jgi:hypothetical protein
MQSASPSQPNLPNFGTPTDLGDFYNHYISRAYFYTRSKYFPENVFQKACNGGCSNSSKNLQEEGGESFI